MYNNTHEKLIQPKSHILIVNHLSHAYKGADKPSLSNINLCIEKGEIFGLIGPNGAGKTTLISILSTLLKPVSGNIQINGMNTNKESKNIRKQIGFIPQELALYNNLTGRENLHYYGTLYGLQKKQLRNDIEKYLKIFGLKDKADNKVGTYSGGMKRRVNLLAGILHKPALLLLDEPTVGIDAQSRNMIMEYLIELKEQGISMIYTTHYMEEIQKMCSRISIIYNGIIIASGNPQMLISENPDCSNLSELFLKLTGKTEGLK